MKNFKIYINTIYKPAFITLSLGLSVFSLALCVFAFNLRADMLAGKSDVIYKYPQMLEQILFPIYILLPVIFVIDMNERKKSS